MTNGFGPDHLPYGSVTYADGEQVLAVRLGDRFLDARAAARAGLLPPECDAPDLDALLAAAPDRWTAVRGAVVDLLGGDDLARAEPHLHALDEVTPVLPFTVGDYVDFYSSEPHATNVGRMFRPDGDPLLPNWKHLPVGYHGRSGTVCVDGTEIVRPTGQRKGGDGPTFGPSQRLDIELELAWVIRAVFDEISDCSAKATPQRLAIGVSQQGANHGEANPAENGGENDAKPQHCRAQSGTRPDR